MKLAGVCIALVLTATRAGAAESSLRFEVPSTVSPDAAKVFGFLNTVRAKQPTPTKPASVEDWDRQRDALEQRLGGMSKATADKLGVTMKDDQIGGVPVLRIQPPGYQPNGTTLTYLHGGAYTFFSAHSDLVAPSLMAIATGDEVISVDYTVAPRGTWKTVTDQVVSVWRALLAQGTAAQSVGLFGDSAGGGLAAGSVLKMRDLGLPLPGALYLMSPEADITATGDTYRTLADVDPVLDEARSSWSADAYALPEDQKNPYVSPVYGDYGKPFPPTLIQGGTRELLLSGFVRQYQAIRGGGHEAILDIYEGMPHDFQLIAPDTPETRTAITRAAAFFKDRLKPAS